MPVQIHHLGPEPVDYSRAWQLQRDLHADVVSGRSPDTVLLLEHAAVYTAGRRTEPLDRPVDGTPVIDVDRGGRITWHGPGQLVGYPVVRLPTPLDVVGHVRRLEDIVMRACTDLDILTIRIDGRSGVWVGADDRGPDRKVAAIGVRVASGVTMHGFAVNADCDTTAYDRIVPCGIRDAGVTSLTGEAGRRISVAEVTPLIEAYLRDVLGPISDSVTMATAETTRKVGA